MFILCRSVHYLHSEQPFGGGRHYTCGWAGDTEIQKTNDLPKVMQLVEVHSPLSLKQVFTELHVRLKHCFCTWWQLHVPYAKQQISPQENSKLNILVDFT